MGRNVEGELLTMQELDTNRLLILTKYKKYLASQLKKLADYTDKLEYPHIFDIGFECEGWFVDDNAAPLPIYDQVSKNLPELGSELLACQWEVKNDTTNLITLKQPLEKIKELINHSFQPLVDEAPKHNAHLLLIGGYPLFTKELGNQMITNSTRHQKLIKYIDSYETNKVTLPFEDGEKKDSGMIYEGYTTSLQITIRVSPIYASLYHDAYYLIAPLLLAITAFSPFIEGKPTTTDSTRIQIVADSVYGFNDEYKELGRPGRWSALPPLSQPDTEPSKWACENLYEILCDKKVPKGISLHFAEAAGKEQGHLLVTYLDLEGDPEESFPSPIMWPYVKFQPFGMNEEGILVELRFIEMVRSREEIAQFLPFIGTMLEVVAQEMHINNLKPIDLKHFAENEKAAIQKDALKNNITFNWPHNNEVIKRPAKDIMYGLMNKMVPFFHKNGRTDEEIGQICNVFINRVGFNFKEGKIEECSPSETAAQELRRKYSETRGPDKFKELLSNYWF